MPRLCCGCLSRRKRKSFPICEKQQDAEVNKIFIRHVENIRITPPPPPIINYQQNKKTISKATVKKKSTDTEINSKTFLSNKQNDSSVSQTPALKSFQKSKQLKTSSPPPPMTEENYDKSITNTVSSWSSSTNTNLHKHKRSSKQRSCAESYDISKEYTTQKKNISQSNKLSNDIKPPAKSKAVLENVRKMIKDQNIQQQHLNHTQQKESIRL